MDSAAEEAYTAVVSRHVAAHLASTASGVFDRPVLPAALQYVARVPLEFLKLLLMPPPDDLRGCQPGGVGSGVTGGSSSGVTALLDVSASWTLLAVICSKTSRPYLQAFLQAYLGVLHYELSSPAGFPVLSDKQQFNKHLVKRPLCGAKSIVIAAVVFLFALKCT